MDRRNVLKSLALVGVMPRSFSSNDRKEETIDCSHLRTSLNAFSFNGPLLKEEMNIEDMIDYCVAEGFDGLDITGYYFPGYPEVPGDEYIYKIKNKAFRAGLAISGTGVRNDFTHADPAKRAESVDLVKKWIHVAQKLGAPVIRVFAGTQDVSAYSRKETMKWQIDCLNECVAFGAAHGVVIGIQNHNDYIKTAYDVHEIFSKISSPWLGLILDTGCYRQGDAYQQIEETIKYTVNWQVKEKIFVEGKEVEADIPRILKIIKKSCYKGYIPIETLGEGDPKVKVRALLARVKAEL